MNIKYIVAALKTVETSKELAKFWNEFGIYDNDEIKVNALMLAMGNIKHSDLSGSFYQRRMVLERMFFNK